MSTTARRRLVRDLKKMQTDPPAGVNAAPLENNLLMWQAVIFGPDDTPWEGGTFQLAMEFSEEYPNKPPKVRFVTPIYHPNVYVDGAICLDLLQSQWSPIYDVGGILASIQSLLCDPNPASPANAEAASLFQTNRAEYERRVRECVEGSWVADPEGAAADAAAAIAAESGSSFGVAAAAATTGHASTSGGSLATPLEAAPTGLSLEGASGSATGSVRIPPLS